VQNRTHPAGASFRIGVVDAEPADAVGQVGAAVAQLAVPATTPLFMNAQRGWLRADAADDDAWNGWDGEPRRERNTLFPDHRQRGLTQCWTVTF